MPTTATASKTDLLDELLDLICLEVQLSPTHVQKARTSYNSVGEWLRDPASPVRKYSPDIFPQGSLRLDTTVRPLSHTEFDLDLVCLVQVPDTVRPGAVYDLLLERMRAHGTYRKMIEEMPRCIRLNYEGDFHLDIVPAVPDPLCPPDETCIKIPDRELRVWRASNPRGYSRWFEDQAKKRLLVEKAAELSANARMEPLKDPAPAYSKPPLKLAVQLLKRWRDVAFEGRMGLAPSSIILTTLAGRLYRGEGHPTEALKTILNGIHAWAEREPIRLRNPSNRKEWITDRWDEKPETYEAFLEAVSDLRVTWQKLAADGRFPHLVRELKELFDETPVKRAFEVFGERRADARKAGSLVAERKTGTLSILPAVPAVATGSSAVRVRDHTFHGRD